MSADSVLAAGRIRAESLMQDTCTITIPGAGAGVYDAATNTTTPPAPVQVYAGPCRLRTPRLLAGTQAVVGPDAITQVYYVISIPVGSVRQGSAVPLVVPKAAKVTVVTSRHDPASPGRVFAVNAVQHETQATAMKMQCIEIQREAS